jgi:hypothetical protein
MKNVVLFTKHSALLILTLFVYREKSGNNIF